MIPDSEIGTGLEMRALTIGGKFPFQVFSSNNFLYDEVLSKQGFLTNYCTSLHRKRKTALHDLFFTKNVHVSLASRLVSMPLSMSIMTHDNDRRKCIIRSNG